MPSHTIDASVVKLKVEAIPGVLSDTMTVKTIILRSNLEGLGNARGAMKYQSSISVCFTKQTEFRSEMLVLLW